MIWDSGGNLTHRILPEKNGSYVLRNLTFNDLVLGLNIYLNNDFSHEKPMRGRESKGRTGPGPPFPSWLSALIKRLSW